MITKLIPGKTLGMYKDVRNPFYSLVFKNRRTECNRISSLKLGLVSDYYIINNKEIMLNIERVQTRDYESLDVSEKYALLLVLIKHILPLINPQTFIIQRKNPSKFILICY